MLLIIAIIIALSTYVVLYAGYDFLTRSHTVDYNVLSSLKNMVLTLPDNIALASLKWMIGIVLIYLVYEKIIYALWPSRAARAARARKRSSSKHPKP